MKYLWITLTLGFICMASYAQQANDSAASLPTHQLPDNLFTSFSYGVKDLNKVMLQWSVDTTGNNDYFIIEHAKDSAHFETLGIQKRLKGVAQYELLDNNALIGYNYYRIKAVDSNDQAVYSGIIQVSSARTSIKFYPNPADKLLIIETEHYADLQIMSSMGAVLINRNLQAGVQIVNLSLLEKGDYILRVVDRVSNYVLLEHLLKN